MADLKELQPYASNVEGLVAVLEDFRATIKVNIFKICLILSIHTLKNY